jgi:hypothetical protein
MPAAAPEEPMAAPNDYDYDALVASAAFRADLAGLNAALRAALDAAGAEPVLKVLLHGSG